MFLITIIYFTTVTTLYFELLCIVNYNIKLL